MKLPNWFKICWWVAITILTGILFYLRVSDIIAGSNSTIDIVVFLVLVALVLVPIFQEVSLFGLKFKQVIDDLQKNVTTQLALFKADIQTTISNTSNVNVNVPYSVPTDDQLPNIKDEIKLAVSEAMKAEGIHPSSEPTSTEMQIDDDIIFLFKTRHTIEKLIRNIARYYGLYSEKRPYSISRLSNMLVKEDFLNPEISHAIREIYAVCSPAIHGDKISKAQVNFVRDIAPQIIDALYEIHHVVLKRKN